MDAEKMEALRFPIGRYRTVERFDRAEVDRGIEALAAFPEEFRARLAPLGDRELDKLLREIGHGTDRNLNC